MKLFVQTNNWIILLFFSITLPLNENINTWLLILLAVTALYQCFVFDLWMEVKSIVLLLAVPFLLFFIKIIGITYSINIEEGLKESIRGLSYVFIPFSFIVLHKTSDRNLSAVFFYGLVLGCLIAIVVCWSNAVSAVIRNNEPIMNLFAWKRSNEYLTKILKIHPPYLGALILTSIFFLFKERLNFKAISAKRNILCLLSFVFVLFLFHLVSRNSILFLLIVSLAYILYSKKWKLLVICCVLGISFSYMVTSSKSSYYNRKYYKMLNFTDERLGDKRFDRLKASWVVFLNHPIVGAGIGNDDIERLENYRLMGFNKAYEQKLNAHNQYLEFLSTFGLMGLLTFLFVLYWAVALSFKTKNYFILLLLGLFMFACLTESFLERELGVKYFSALMSILIYKVIKNENNLLIRGWT